MAEAGPGPDERSSRGVRLRPFEPLHAAVVLGWARSSEEREAWASIVEPEPDVSVFERWHGDPHVHPFELTVDGRLRGYGEVWEDPHEDEAELARLIVDPDARGRGLGRTLAALLGERARGLGYERVWVRVAPANAPALAAYSAAGFRRATAQDEAAFNALQPRPYVWMWLGDA